MSGSATDTPLELEIDLSDARGDVVFMEHCITLLSSDEGLKTMRAYLRRFKRKGPKGGDGTPGDVDQLVEDLLKNAGEEADEESLREVLEGNDIEAWTKFILTFNNVSEPNKIAFMVTLNKIKWIIDKN